MNDLIPISQETNYLDPQSFHKFISTIPRIPTYHSAYVNQTSMPPFGYQLLFQILYYCALRVSEGLNLVKSDFDLDRRILRIRNAKTSKGKVQKTSIPPPLLQILKSCWDKLPEKLFSTSRQTTWSVGKQVGKLAELNIFEEQDERSIEGVWTHLFRKSYAKFMYNNGATGALIDVKLRHSKPKSRDMADSTFTYIKPDINKLIHWEHERFTQHG
ncbi:MAG: tyrosine-type recombinase/integrase [Thermodesulfobacteriota bacterium]